MKRIVPVCLIFLVGVLPVHAADTPPLEDGLYWYNHRAKGSTGATAKPEPISKAIEFLGTALEEANDTATEIKAAKYLLLALYVKGTHVSLSSDNKQDVFARGKQLGERMLEKYPESVPILYGYVINLGRWAEVYGILSAAREGVAGTMRDYSRKIAQLDSTYEGGAGYRLLGIVYHESPYIPLLLSWPSNKRALGYLEKALEVAPEDPANLYYYAKVQNALGQQDKARETLQKVLSMEPREAYRLDDVRMMNLAEALQQTIQE